MSIEVFVSHSHDDELLAAALVKLLNRGAGVETDEIRCTSHAPTSLSPGSKIAGSLREDLEDCRIFIPLITKNFHEGEFVFIEIGAAWVLETPIIPAVFRMADSSRMPTILSDLVYSDLTKETDVEKLVRKVNRKIFKAVDQANDRQIKTAAKTFMGSVRNL